MTNIKEKSNETILITKYYNLSKLTNKYITIVVSLVLSILIFSFNTSSSNNVSNINTVSNNILTKNKKINIWLNNHKFNKLSKNLKSDIIITKSYITNKKNYLWMWIFMNKKETLYLPINIILFNNKKINTRTYSIIIKNWIKNNSQIKINPLKTKIQLTTWDLNKKYNLSCINTIFNNSLFCNLNKKIILNKLIKQKSFELKKESYNYLFNNLSYDKKTKCNIIKKIFNIKYNLNNIKDITDKYCQNTDNIWYTNMFKIIDIYNTILWKNLFNNKISEYQDVALTKLAQQQFNLLKSQDTISYTKILYHLSLIRNIIDSSYMNEDTAIVTKKILENIKENSKYSDNYNKIKEKIKAIEIWNTSIWENWLNKYIIKKQDKKTNNKKNNNNIIIIKNKIHSQKELISNIFNSNYKNTFAYTKIIYNKDTKIANIEWYITLSFKKKKWEWIIKKILSIKFNLTNLVWINFQISNIQIKDAKINKYINFIWYNINKENTLSWLKNYLEKILYNPLILNDYGKKKELTICDKVKKNLKEWTSCSSWIITVNIKDRNILWWLNLSISLNNSLLVKSIKLDKENIKYKNKSTVIKEVFDLNLSNINKKLQKIIWEKITNSTLSKIDSFIKKDINNIKEEKITEIIWMSDSNIIILNQKFKDKLWTNIKLIRHIKWDYYKVYFNLWLYTFVWIYQFNKNKILHLWILVWKTTNQKLFLFKNTNIILSNNNIEKLNQFKLDTENMLKEIDSKKYQEYQDYIKKHKN